MKGEIKSKTLKTITRRKKYKSKIKEKEGRRKEETFLYKKVSSCKYYVLFRVFMKCEDASMKP